MREGQLVINSGNPPGLSLQMCEGEGGEPIIPISGRFPPLRLSPDTHVLMCHPRSPQWIGPRGGGLLRVFALVFLSLINANDIIFSCCPRSRSMGVALRVFQQSTWIEAARTSWSFQLMVHGRRGPGWHPMLPRRRAEPVGACGDQKCAKRKTMGGRWKECDCAETPGSLSKRRGCVSGHHSVKVMPGAHGRQHSPPHHRHHHLPPPFLPSCPKY